MLVVVVLNFVWLLAVFLCSQWHVNELEDYSILLFNAMMESTGERGGFWLSAAQFVHTNHILFKIYSIFGLCLSYCCQEK